MPKPKQVKLSDILDESIETTRKRINRKGIKIYKKLKTLHKVHTEADPFQISEVFNNVFINAFQAIDGNSGKIFVEGELDETGYILIKIKDNGAGMDEENLKQVFEPFYTSKSKGTGLGLTICKELISLHGGDILIHSKRSKGTTVTVKLPYKRK